MAFAVNDKGVKVYTDKPIVYIIGEKTLKMYKLSLEREEQTFELVYKIIEKFAKNFADDKQDKAEKDEAVKRGEKEKTVLEVLKKDALPFIIEFIKIAFPEKVASGTSIIDLKQHDILTKEFISRNFNNEILREIILDFRKQNQLDKLEEMIKGFFGIKGQSLLTLVGTQAILPE